MILCLGPTPTMQRTMLFAQVTIDAVNRTGEIGECASGKSINVARVAHTLGARVLAMGFAGGMRGERLRADLTAGGIAHDFVTVKPHTRLCITVVDRAAGTATELVEESAPLADEDYAALLVRVEDRLEDFKAIVLSGSLTPGGPAGFYAEIVRRAVERGIPTLVDAREQPLLQAAEAGATICKPNASELAATLGRSIDSTAALADAIAALCSRGAGWTAVTAGKADTFVGNGKVLYRLRTPEVKVISPIGSGDAFAAGLICGMLRDLPMPEAARLAVACGAANAMTDQAGVVDQVTVEKLVEQVACERVA
jgi:tagatose 6-phosphate kinase